MSDTFTRLDRRNGERNTVSRAAALRQLTDGRHELQRYTAERLDAVTEAAPVQTPFASYWPTATVKRTAGQAIAHAMSMFIGGTIGERELATAIDDALRSYR